MGPRNVLSLREGTPDESSSVSGKPTGSTKLLFLTAKYTAYVWLSRASFAASEQVRVEFRLPKTFPHYGPGQFTTARII